AFLSAVTGHADFAGADSHPGSLDTGLIERNRAALFPEPMAVPDDILAVAALSEILRMDEEAALVAARSSDPHSPWHSRHGWRLNEDNHHAFAFMDAAQRKAVVAHFRNGGYLLDLPGGGNVTASASRAQDDAIDVELGGRHS